MTDAAVIDRFAVRWRLAAVPGAQVPAVDRARLDGLVARLLDGPLEDALAPPGVGPGEELCLRHVAVPPVRARWEDSDAAIVDGWSRAIGAAVTSALRAAADDPVRPDAIHYRSPSHARVDLAVRGLLGDLSRAWAWRQLGLWPAGLPVDGSVTGPVGPAVADRVAAVLADEPQLMVAAFVALAERGRDRLAAAVSALGAGALARLAEGAWRAVGGVGLIATTAADRLTRVPGPSPGAAGGLPGLPPVRPAGDARASTVVRRSRIVAAVAGRAHQPPAVLAALAALAVLEAEPGAARGAAEAGGDPVGLVAAVAEAMARGGAGPGPPRPEPSLGDVVALPAEDADSEAGAVAVAGGRAEPEAGRTDAALTVPAWTAWGGLLFLVHVLDDLGVPDRLQASPDVAAAGLRAVLHALGTALLARVVTAADPPVAPDDPALLAFCGLVPADRPPDLPDEARATLAPLVHREADAVAGELARGLAPPPGEEGTARAREDRLLDAVCRRAAEVVADPGWIDVVLELDDVSTDVRRAGLDLDPGFVGWLGAVVRFRYA